MSHRRHPVWKTLVLMAADAAAICIGLLGAYWLRFESEWIQLEKGWVPQDYLRALPICCAFWIFSLRLENLYRRRSPALDFNVARRIVTGSILAAFLFFTFAFFERRDPPFSRLMPPIVLAMGVGCLLVERAFLHLLFQGLAVRRQTGLARTLVLGGGEIAARVFESLRRHPEHGLAPVGALVDPEGGRAVALPEGVPILGAVDDLERVLHEQDVREVILAQPDLDRARIPSLLMICERNLADFRIVPDTTELLFSGMVVETLEGIPMLGARSTPLQGWNAAIKRLVDVLASGIGLLAVSPLLVVVAWLVRRQGDGPVLYRQERMGLDGRRFLICKFRTMRVDAENETGPVFADDDDPRCTPLGAFLRKYRIDELPQLLNVLRGDMSLVGPRPERPYFVERFRDDIPRYMSRHKVKSGITGWAQINGLCGKHGSISERLRYDLYYVENWTLWLDVKILFLTFYRTWVAGTGSA